MDNFRLKSIAVEYSSENQNEWETAFSSNISSYSGVVDFALNSDGMASGNYEFRTVLTDTSGNRCEKYMGIYTYVEGDLSVPVVTATPGGCKADISWTANTSKKLSYYLVYRKASASGEYECIKKTTSTSFSDEMLSPDKTYFYMVKAVDIYGNMSSSDFVFVFPTAEDSYAPTAYAKSGCRSIAGETLSFDGTASYDNIAVTSYSWSFGDGTVSAFSKPKHIYTQEGTYTVSLTVKDAYGNSDTDTLEVTVLGSEYKAVTVCVTDLNGSPLPNAMVYCEASDGTVNNPGTDSSGKAQLVLEKGVHKIFIYKENYLPVSKEITVSDESLTIVAELEEKELVSAEFDVKPMDLNEIIACGIDITAPENQFVYKYTFKLRYLNDENWVVYQNSSGEIVKGTTTFTRNGRTVTLQPYVWGNVPFIAVVEIDTTVSWLKEFFAVNLTLINNASEEFSIVNSSVKLNMPDGLSLADTSRDQKLTQNIGTISGQEEKTISWIIRGDKAGEYDLTADFSGTLMPFGLDVNAIFASSEPVVVHGGNALQFDVVHDIWGITGDYWDTTFTLTNISDRDLYNVTVSIGGFAEFFEVTDMQLVYPDGSVIIVPWNDGKPDEENAEIFLPALYEKGCDNFMTLKPGESITGVYSIKPQV
ncbi:MAG: PKD domain-containing protein [Oscillospiraceae bacterium]